MEWLGGWVSEILENFCGPQIKKAFLDTPHGDAFYETRTAMHFTIPRTAMHFTLGLTGEQREDLKVVHPDRNKGHVKSSLVQQVTGDAAEKKSSDKEGDHKPYVPGTRFARTVEPKVLSLSAERTALRAAAAHACTVCLLGQRICLCNTLLTIFRVRGRALASSEPVLQCCHIRAASRLKSAGVLSDTTLETSVRAEFPLCRTGAHLGNSIDAYLALGDGLTLQGHVAGTADPGSAVIRTLVCSRQTLFAQVKVLGPAVIPS